jgi:S-(hydroxymethyl)glutathione dehydrogenase/alcohol dehydrogenase
MLVHENAMVKIDPDIPLDRAALVGCGVMTGVGAVFNAAKVEPRATVAVIGCGGVGLSAVNGAALAGAEARDPRHIASDPRENGRSALLGGATEYVRNPRRARFFDRLIILGYRGQAVWPESRLLPRLLSDFRRR